MRANLVCCRQSLVVFLQLEHSEISALIRSVLSLSVSLCFFLYGGGDLQPVLRWLCPFILQITPGGTGGKYCFQVFSYLPAGQTGITYLFTTFPTKNMCIASLSCSTGSGTCSVIKSVANRFMYPSMNSSQGGQISGVIP